MEKIQNFDLTENETLALIVAFKMDYQKFTFIPLSNSILDLAVFLINQYGQQGLRTLDSIQLASAESIKGELLFAITNDDLLNNILKQEGIPIYF